MNIIRELACEYYTALGTPLALNLRKLAEEGRWGEIAKCSVDPAQYQDSEAYFLDALAASFCKKLVVPGKSKELELAALTKWLECEKKCFQTNREFYPYVDGLIADPRVDELFARLRKNTSFLLGRAPTSLQGRFGPGTTVMHSGSRSLIPDKLAATPEMTEQAWVHLRGWTETAWARALAGNLFMDESCAQPFEVPVVPGNKWDSVPKNALTNRSIGIEPTLNLWYQLGIGAEMKLRLNLHHLLLAPKKRWSDLLQKHFLSFDSESQELHRRLARTASLDGELATVDLRSASDTIARSIVHLSFTKDWVDLWESVRSPSTLVDGRPYRLEKFSSMGNGFTFELETTLFCAAAMMACEAVGIAPLLGENVSVFGDDILLPVAAYPFLESLLRYLGFIINEEKTFTSGPFRESCGGDFFNGIDVRPIFVSDVPSTPAEWIVLANKLYTIQDRVPSLKRVRNKVLSMIPTDVRKCRGPQNLGDIVITEDDESKWQLRIYTTRNEKRPSGHREICVVLPQVDRIPLERWDDLTAITSLLYGVPSTGVAPRGEPRGYRIKWVAFP